MRERISKLLAALLLLVVTFHTDKLQASVTQKTLIPNRPTMELPPSPGLLLAITAIRYEVIDNTDGWVEECIQRSDRSSGTSSLTLSKTVLSPIDRSILVVAGIIGTVFGKKTSEFKKEGTFSFRTKITTSRASASLQWRF